MNVINIFNFYSFLSGKGSNYADLIMSEVCGWFGGFDDKIFQFQVPLFSHSSPTVTFKIYWTLNHDDLTNE